MSNGDNDIRIDLNADASGFKAGVAEANASLDSLTRSFKQPSAALDAVTQKNDSFVASLRRQVDTFGMSRGQVVSYDAQIRGLTGVHLESANALGKQLDMLDANEKMMGRVKIAAAAAGAVIAAVFVRSMRQMYQEVTEAEQSGARLEAVLRATGGAARLSVGDIRAMSEELARSTLFDQEQIQDAAAVMLTFKNVQGDTFRQAMQMSADLAATFGGDLQSAVMQLGKALEDPEHGLSALKRAGVVFTDEQKNLIKSLVETGRQGEALTLILEALRVKGLDGTAQAMKTGITKEADDLGKAWRDLLQTLGETDAVSGLTERALGRLSLYLTDMKNVIESGDWADKLAFFMTGGGWKTDRIKDMRAPQQHGASGSWGEPAVPPPPSADPPADAAAAKAAAAAAAAAAKAYSDAIKRSTEYLDALKAETAALSLNKDQQDAVRMAKEAMQAPTARLRAETMAAVGANLLERARIADLAEEEKQRTEILKRLTKAQTEATDAAKKDAASIQDQVLVERARNEEIGLTVAGLFELEQGRLDATIAATEQFEAERILLGASNEELESIWEKIDALKELKQLRATGAAAREAADAAKAAETEWARVSDNIEQSLTDALMRGFEGGKDWAKNFKDTLANMFKTLVLRPLIQPVAQAGASMVTGMLGMGASGTASAAGGGFTNSLLGSVGGNVAGSALGGYLGSLGTMASYGTAAATGGMLAGATQGGMLAAQTGAFGAFGASSTASALGGAAATGGGFAGMAAAALPWVAAIGAIVMLVDAFSQGGTPHLGNTYEFDQTGITGNPQWNSMTQEERDAVYGKPGWLYGPDGPSPYDDAIQQAGLSLTQKIAADMEALGGEIDQSFGFSLGFAAENEAETRSGGAASVTIGGETVLDLYKRYAKDGKTGLEEFLNDVMPKVELVSLQVATGLHPAIEALADSVDVSTASIETVNEVLETIGEWGPLLGAMQDYIDADPLTEALDQIDAAGQTAWQTWQSGNTSLRDMAASYDGSLAMAQQLATATQNQYQMELSLIGQIQGLLSSTSAMFGNSIEQIQLSVMDQAQQYDYWRTATDEAFAALMVATDPAEIAQLSGRLDQTANSAWGLLDAEQRAALAPEFVAFFEESDAMTTERLNASQDLIVSSHNDLATVIETTMAAVADKMLEAANITLAAAQTPVEVSVDVSVDVPASVEVG